ncbi:hypothetical protein KA529_01825 [Candidatus Saccharibacteria bacterium]|jgi:hypothetical protein|nr:hypothetical protein [Candidatus Saccharibacteria bacterium]
MNNKPSDKKLIQPASKAHRHGNLMDQLAKEYKMLFIDRWMYVFLAVSAGLCLLAWVTIIEQ